MKKRIFAATGGLTILGIILTFVAWQMYSDQIVGDEGSWAEISLCPIDVENQETVPDEFDIHLNRLSALIAEEEMTESVADLFANILPKSSCLQQLEQVSLERVEQSNRIKIRMPSDNPLVGSRILHELLTRVSRRFIDETSDLGSEQHDLNRIRASQQDFQVRIAQAQQELSLLSRDNNPPASTQAKISSLSQRIQQLTRSDELMKEQLDTLEEFGKDMTFLEPTLKWQFTQSPTFNAISQFQLEDYSLLQKENRSLLSPLTPAMQQALKNGKGFRVQ